MQPQLRMTVHCFDFRDDDVLKSTVAVTANTVKSLKPCLKHAK